MDIKNLPKLKSRLMFPLLLLCISLTLSIYVLFSLSLISFIISFSSFLLLLILYIIIFTDQRLSLLSPIHFLFYFTFLQIVIKTLYILYSFPDYSTINEAFLHGNPVSFLIIPAVLYILSYLMLALGFFIIPKTFYQKKSPDYDQKFNNKQIILLGIITFISFFALLDFVNKTVGSFLILTIENVSQYRGLSDSTNDYQSYSFHRFIIQLSQIPFYILLNENFIKKNKNILSSVILFISFCIYIFFSFYTQSRGSIIFLILNSFILLFFSNKTFVKPRYVILSLPIILYLNSLMTTIREGKFDNLFTISLIDISKLFEPILISISGLDYSKTYYIIKHINENNNFQYGIIILQNFFYWIPRSLWNSKPLTLDTYFGEKVYGAQTYGSGGVPPGFIAEMYFNFGLLGIIFGSFVLGIFVKFVFNYLYRRFNIFEFKVYYILFFVNILFSIYGSSFNSTFIGFTHLFIPIFFIFNLMKSLNNK